MPPGVATLVFTAVIFCLFWLDRDPEPRVSPALWIPIAWLAQAGSRLASEWMMGSDAVEVGSTALSSDRYMEGSPIDRFILSSLLMAGVLVLLGASSSFCTAAPASSGPTIPTWPSSAGPRPWGISS